MAIFYAPPRQARTAISRFAPNGRFRCPKDRLSFGLNKGTLFGLLPGHGPDLLPSLIPMAPVGATLPIGGFGFAAFACSTIPLRRLAVMAKAPELHAPSCRRAEWRALSRSDRNQRFSGMGGKSVAELRRDIRRTKRCVRALRRQTKRGNFIWLAAFLVIFGLVGGLAGGWTGAIGLMATSLALVALGEVVAGRLPVVPAVPAGRSISRVRGMNSSPG